MQSAKSLIQRICLRPDIPISVFSKSLTGNKNISSSRSTSVLSLCQSQRPLFVSLRKWIGSTSYPRFQPTNRRDIHHTSKRCSNYDDDTEPYSGSLEDSKDKFFPEQSRQSPHSDKVYPRKRPGKFSSYREQDDYDDGYYGHVEYRTHKRSNRSSYKERHFDRDHFEDFDYDGPLESRSDRYRELGSGIKKREWKAENLAAIEKNFYVLHESVSERSKEDIDAFYASHGISVTRGDAPIPITDFHEAQFPEQVNKMLKRNSFSNPTPIQSLGWPLALSGKNTVGIAQTGSGKTLGFVLPALVHIKHQRPIDRGDGPVVLVLAPTRELAQQIHGVACEYGRPLGIRSCCIFGGHSKFMQARQLSEGPELVVATPGRLLDFIETEVINLDRTTYVVLDEADRMLDMGFEPQIRKVLGQIRPDHQILMWSATWPSDIQQLAHDFLGDFAQVNIGSSELMANPNIEQIVRVCEGNEKMAALMHELKVTSGMGAKKTLIFSQTKRHVDLIGGRLRRQGFNVATIHGDKSQKIRDLTLNSFRNGRTTILVATDVAARGLDVDDIKVVINYDLPSTMDNYIHRIGRTARADKKGVAVSLVTDDDARQVDELIAVLEKSDQTVDAELRRMAMLYSKFNRKGPSSRKGAHSRKTGYPNSFGRPGRRNSW